MFPFVLMIPMINWSILLVQDLEEGYISATQNLEYVIRFQNTGNATAINVTIRDQIDSNLDLNSFEFISSSHPVDVKIESISELCFRFENINLPGQQSERPCESWIYKI